MRVKVYDVFRYSCFSVCSRAQFPGTRDQRHSNKGRNCYTTVFYTISRGPQGMVSISMTRAISLKYAANPGFFLKKCQCGNII